MTTNRSAPPATVTPVLVYPDVRAAVDWLEKAFGFVERVRIGDAHRSQMSVGADGAIVVADVRHSQVAPSGGVVTQLIKIRVEDVDAAVARSVEAGALVIDEPQTFEYGERSCLVEDLAGHRWELTQTMRDVAPEDWGGTAVNPWRYRGFMGFEVAAEAYDAFMGRYSQPLGHEFIELIELRPGMDALDVGCGPGALTEVLAERLGPDHVKGIDPSKAFVAAARQRLPDVRVVEGNAEDLPYADDSFDVVVAQLVVHFMRRPVPALREMSRVARPGGFIGATVWDHAGLKGPITPLWEAVRTVRPDETGESLLPGSGEGDLLRLFEEAGLGECDQRVLSVTVHYESFDQWWTPYTLGVGPAGEFLKGLAPAEVEAVRDECLARLSSGPFDISASAWCVTTTL